MGTAPPHTAFEHLKATEFETKVRRLNELSARVKEFQEEMKDIRFDLGVDLDTIGVKSVLVDDYIVGIVEYKGRAKLDTERVQTLLIEEGIGADLVLRCFEESTTVGKPSITVSIRKKDGGNRG